MDANTITTLVSTLGFPIVCCGALFWYVNKTQKEFTEKMEKSIEALNTSINDMNTTLATLITTVSVLHKIGGENDG